MNKKELLAHSLPEIEAITVEASYPKFRAKQIFHWIHEKKSSEFAEMKNISKDVLSFLEENYTITYPKVLKKLASKLDGTVKYLYELFDGETVEVVLMQYSHGASLCISTQVGCKMGCDFCASTIAGFARNLSASEILSEVYAIEKESGKNISNLVLMGIGEPLDNYDEVLRFLKRLNDKDGRNFSLRNVTLSTCGLVPEIRKLAKEKLGLTLAVSLHAPNDAIRTKTMPIAKKYPMKELLAACKDYSETTGRRVSYEYALIAGVNDAPEHAEELSKRLRGQMCHVNLIPVNRVEERDFIESETKTRTKFLEILEKNKIATTVRRTLGADINAACGQLRRAEMKRM